MATPATTPAEASVTMPAEAPAATDATARAAVERETSMAHSAVTSSPLGVTAPPADPIVPRVTVLSGFLGSGKTTLLKHLLTAAPSGTRVAVVVNDMAEINIDASLIRRVGSAPAATAGAPLVASAAATPDASTVAAPGAPTMVELHNGCICCTLRDDLIDHLAALARTAPPFDAIIVESTGVAEPRPVAESFQFEVDPAAAAAAAAGKVSDAAAVAGSGGDAGGDGAANGNGTADGAASEAPSRRRQREAVALNDIAPLDTLVTVVDVSTFGEMLATTDAPVDRWGPSGTKAAAADGGAAGGASDAAAKPGADPESAAQAEAEEFRPLSQLLVEQVEYANVVVLNKTDLVPAATVAAVRAQVRALNRTAEMVETSHSRVPFARVVATRAFDDLRLRSGAGWLSDMRAADGGSDGVPRPRPAADDPSAGAVRSELTEFNLSSFVYRRRRPFHPVRLAAALDALCELGEVVLRAKGFVWVATRHELFGDLSKAGATWTLGRGGTWLVTDPYYRRLAARKFGTPPPYDVPATAGPDAALSAAEELDRAAASARGTAVGATGEEDGEEADEFAAAALADFDPLLGDRRQEVVVIGRGMSKPAVEEVLDAALLKDYEFAVGSRQWALLTDELDGWSDGDDDNDDDGSDGDESGSGSDGGDGEAAEVGRGSCTNADCTSVHAPGKRVLDGATEGDVVTSKPKKGKSA